MKCDELKPLVFSLKDLAYIDEPAAQKNFENPHEHAVYKATEVDAAIAELKQKLEDAKATAYAESVDAGMRERRLKRALYKACANWAHHRVFVRFKTNEKAWENVERKCRAKAEEYL